MSGIVELGVRTGILQSSLLEDILEECWEGDPRPISSSLSTPF